MIRKLTLAVAALAALSLAACAPITASLGTGSAPPGVSATVDTITLNVDKARLIAWGAFDAASLAAKAAADSGLLHGPPAAKVSAALERAHNALILSDAAMALGDMAALSLNLTRATDAVAQAQALIGDH